METMSFKTGIHSRQVGSLFLSFKNADRVSYLKQTDYRCVDVPSKSAYRKGLDRSFYSDHNSYQRVTSLRKTKSIFFFYCTFSCFLYSNRPRRPVNTSLITNNAVPVGTPFGISLYSL